MNNDETPILLGQLGSEPARFSLWYVSVGETVAAGDRIAEVLIPGACCEIVSPAAGEIATLTAHPGDAVATGDVLATLRPTLDSDRTS